MKNQVSIEFIVVLMLLISAMSILSVVSIQKTKEIETLKLQQETESVLQEAGGKINTVYLEGSGFSSNVTLPEKIVVFNYTVSIQKNFLVITVQGSSYSKNLLTENITGNFNAGENMLTNENGMVVIS